MLLNEIKNLTSKKMHRKHFFHFFIFLQFVFRSYVQICIDKRKTELLNYCNMPKNLNYIIIITIHWKSIIYISLKNLITSSPEIQFGFKFKKIKMQK